jgi:hypothetical protein
MRLAAALRRNFSALKEYGPASDLGISMEPTKFYLQKLKDSRLTLFTGDIDRMAQILAINSTLDFVEFKQNNKCFAASAQFLDSDLGTVDLDFTVIKPISFKDGRIRPVPGEWMVETSIKSTNDVIAKIKYLSKRKHSLRMINLFGEVFSYRVFNLETTYDSQVSLAGKLNKSFYPPRDQRQDTDDDDFLDVCVYHPKSHDLWYSIYSANPKLDLGTGFVEKAKGWEYQALRYYNKIPEFDECTDLKVSTVWGRNVIVNSNEYPGKLNFEGRNGMVTIGYVDKENWGVSGMCCGIPETMIRSDITVPADTHIEKKDGSRPVSVLASAWNVCLVFVEDSCKERIFQLENGLYLHVMEKYFDDSKVEDVLE